MVLRQRKKEAVSTALLVILIVGAAVATVVTLQSFKVVNLPATSGSSPPALVAGRHLGFWVAEDDIWAMNPAWTPQQFFNNYFLTQPYPSTMQWTTGLTPTGPSAPSTSNAEATWFSGVASLADAYPSVQMTMLIFVDLSGYSIITYEGTHSPNFAIHRTSSPTVDPSKTGSYAAYNVTGLSPSTKYSIVLNNNLNSTIATITTFTTNSTGGYSGTFQVPNEPESQNLWYITIQGTGISYSVALQADQTTDLTNYMNLLVGHRSIYGAQYEPEYFGDSVQENQAFCNIVSAAGYACIQGPGSTTFPAVDYSQYPYYTGVVQSSLTNPPYVGIGYGEVGAPICTSSPCPAWTQTTVTNIVDNSAPNLPFTYIYSENDANNPIGNTVLWNNPTLRGWIWNDPNYQANYQKSNSSPPVTTTSSTSSTTSTVSGQPSATTSPVNGVPPPASGDLTFSSGLPEVNPQSNSVYSQNPVLMRFYLPQAVSSWNLEFFASAIGTISNPLYVAILKDSNQGYLTGAPVLSSVLANSTASGITQTADWVTVKEGVSLAPGYYWAAFSTSGGSSSNYYSIQSTNQIAYPDIYVYAPSQVGGGFNGIGKLDLGSVIWITDSSGNTLSVYPLLSEATNFRAAGSSIQLKVTQSMNVNMISFFVSDRAFDPNNITISLQQGSTVLATGAFSNKMFRGINDLSYTPVQLSKVVSLQPGVSYTISFGNLPAGDSYVGSIGGGVSQDLITSQANPSLAGYLGQSSWPLFTLGLMNLNYPASFPDYASSTDLKDSPGYQGDEVALRFLATQNENLQSFSVNVIGVSTLSGSLAVTLRSDDGGRPTPLSVSSALATGSIGYASVNSNLTSCATNTGQCTFATTHFSGSTSLTAGNYYWIVMSGNIALDRLVSPFSSLVYTSPNDFSTSWSVPADGPTDLAYQIVTSGQMISNTFLGQTQFAIGQSNLIAQSFSVPNSLSLKGVWIHTGKGYNLNVAIEQDSGSNTPSGTPIGIASMPAYVASNSMNYASLPTSITLTAGTKYWLVVSGTCTYSACSSPDYIYANQHRSDDQNKYGNFEYLTSQNGGSTWIAPGASGDMPFLLAGYNSSQPIPTTTITTTATSSQITASTTATTSSSYSTGSSTSIGYISILANGGPYVAGSPIGLSGTTMSTNGQTLPSQTIYLWVNGNIQGSATSGQNGNWASSFTPMSSGSYFVSASQSPSGSGVTSPQLVLSVAPGSSTASTSSSYTSFTTTYVPPITQTVPSSTKTVTTTSTTTASTTTTATSSTTLTSISDSSGNSGTTMTDQTVDSSSHTTTETTGNTHSVKEATSSAVTVANSKSACTGGGCSFDGVHSLPTTLAVVVSIAFIMLASLPFIIRRYWRS